MHFKFRPIFKQTLWGGSQIAAYKQIDTALDAVGESWEVSAIPGAESVVADGEYQGLTLSELLLRLKERLVGKENYSIYGDKFPLLVKFIDAHQDLSIQVHPDDALARKRHGMFGKNEMWYVIGAEKDAMLIAGFSQEITLEEYENRVKSGTFPEVLHTYKPKAGDTYYIPAGRVHGLGAGLLVAEIQQSSDITYRIYDYLRKDKQGNYRELHTELAKEAINFRDVHGDAEVDYQAEENQPTELLTTPYFSVSLYDMTEPITCDYSELDSFVIYVCVEGACTLKDEEGKYVFLRQGESVLFAASTQSVTITPQGNVKLLETYV